MHFRNTKQRKASNTKPPSLPGGLQSTFENMDADYQVINFSMLIKTALWATLSTF
jgi:hypothetical protein